MSLQTKLSVNWDVDVIDYWQTSLSSYKKHHQEDIVESDKVVQEILDSLPSKDIGEDVLIETEPVKVSVKRKEATQEAQVGNWSFIEEEEEKEEVEEKQGEKDSVKKPRYNSPPPVSVPPVSVPPASVPLVQQQDSEALSNLMMAWYYAGYYTGIYQANQTQ